MTLSASRYRPGEPVSTTVANGLGATIYTMDSKSECAIVYLQRLSGTAWADVSLCPEMRPPATAAIGPGRGRTVVLAPAGLGTYRVRFSYGTAEGDESQTAFSPSFLVG